MTKPIDLVTQALINIGALAEGENPSAAAATSAFNMLNFMLDQWSNESLMVYAQQEVIHELTAGQYIYTIGPGGMVGAAFTASIAGNVLTVSALASGALSVGQLLSGSNILPNTIITGLGTAIGGNSTGVTGTYYLSQTYTTVASQAMTSSAQRPLRINSAFVRIFNSISGTLDYTVNILSAAQYEQIGIKTLPGPWPRALYYSPQLPLGVLYYWQNPSQGEIHLWCDTLLRNFSTLQDTITLPQGYAMAIIWNLSRLLMPQYGKASETQIGMVNQFANEGKALVKRTNANPQTPAQFDISVLGHQAQDAGWILSGGFQ